MGLMMTSPDLSEVYKFPVDAMSWPSMACIIEDLVSDALMTLNEARRDGTGLDAAFNHAGGRLTLSYNYLERWVEASKERINAEPF